MNLRFLTTEITEPEPNIFSVCFVSFVVNDITCFMNTRESNQKEVASDDSDENTAFNGAELSESVLGRDWNLPEEDAAWSNL